MLVVVGCSAGTAGSAGGCGELRGEAPTLLRRLGLAVAAAPLLLGVFPPSLLPFPPPQPADLSYERALEFAGGKFCAEPSAVTTQTLYCTVFFSQHN